MGKWSIRMTILTVTLALYVGSLCVATEAGTQTETPAARQRIGMSSSGTVHRQSGKAMESGVRPGDRMPSVALYDMGTQKMVSNIGQNHRAALLYMAQSIPHSIQLDKKLQFVQEMQKKYKGRADFYIVFPATPNQSRFQELRDWDISLPKLYTDQASYSKLGRMEQLIFIDRDGYVRYAMNTWGMGNQVLEHMLKEVMTTPLPADAGERQVHLLTERIQRQEMHKELHLPEAWPKMVQVATVWRDGILKDLTYGAANQAAQDPVLYRPVMEAAWADQQQDYVRAAAACEEALRLKPDNAHLHALRAYNWLLQGNERKARDELKKAVLLSPHDAGLCWNLALLEYNQGRPLEAAHWLEQADRTYIPAREQAYYASWLSIYGGKVQEGLARYASWLAKDTNPARGNTDYALLLIQAGRYEDAAGYLGKALQCLDTERQGSLEQAFRSQLYAQKAWCEWKSHKNRTALADITKALEGEKRQYWANWNDLRDQIRQELGMKIEKRNGRGMNEPISLPTLSEDWKD